MHQNTSSLMIVLNGQHRCKLLYARNQNKWMPMKRRGHRGVNLLVLSGFSYMLLPERPLLALLAWTAWFLEPIPDKDQDVGLTHRGTSHSFFAAALAGVIVGGAGWLVGKHLLQPGMHALFAMPIDASRSTFMWWASRVAALDASTLATVGFWIGAGSFLMHYLGDIITTGGLQPLLPFSPFKVRISPLSYDNPAANSGVFALGVLAVLASIAGILQTIGVV